MPAATMRLTLVRHGQAEWTGPRVADADRPLPRRGQAEAAEMARRLRTQEFDPPGMILTSPALRTTQTAEAYLREFGLAGHQLKRVDSLYLAPPAELAVVIRASGQGIPHLLVIGHNPGLSEFAHELAPQAALGAFATGACCTLAFEFGDWRDLGRAMDAGYDAPGRFFDLWH